MIDNSAKPMLDGLSGIFVQSVIIRAHRLSEVDMDAIPGALRLASAREKRQREYVAGRYAARDAIAEFRHNPEFPAQQRSRAPVWPEDLCGSITHSGDLAVAAVAPSTGFGSLGIDIEEVREISDSVRNLVLTTNEMDYLADATGNLATQQVLRYFSYKESMYKCIFPRYGAYIDFTDVEIRKERTGLGASCTDANHPAARLVAAIQGDSRIIDNHVVSACWLPVDL